MDLPTRLASSLQNHAPKQNFCVLETFVKKIPNFEVSLYSIFKLFLQLHFIFDVWLSIKYSTLTSS